MKKPMSALFLLVSLSINVMAMPNESDGYVHSGSSVRGTEEDIDDDCLECYIKRQVIKQVAKQLEDTKQQFSSQIEEIKNQRVPSKCFCFDSPVGEIIAFAGINGTRVDTAGYIPCDGRELSVLEYLDLFQAIGTIYGASGTNFRVPDYRGMFLRGAGGDAAPLGQRQSDVIRFHRHYTFSSTGHNGRHNSDHITAYPNNVPANSAFDARDYVDYAMLKAPDNSDASCGVTSKNIAGGDETRPVNYAVNHYIKATDRCKNMCQND
jgi:microcystin-dependent protein